MDHSFSQYKRWSTFTPIAKEGVIVASDISQEWLLPWWLNQYNKYNSYPVAFIDFGMSLEMKSWCKEQGIYIPLPIPDIFVTDKSETEKETAQRWENLYGTFFWTQRNGWFKKPFACLLSPYEKTVWFDLDCEVRGSIQKLFVLCENDLAIAKDQIGPGFNSGVLAFKRGLSCIELWAERCLLENHSYPGDQDILSEIIETQNISVCEIHPLYNWSRSQDLHPDAVIYHWHGPHGKTVIANKILQSNLS